MLTGECSEYYSGTSSVCVVTTHCFFTGVVPAEVVAINDLDEVRLEGNNLLRKRPRCYYHLSFFVDQTLLTADFPVTGVPSLPQAITQDVVNYP